MLAMCRDGSTVHAFGNAISASGRGMSETYVLCGNMLMGPRGFRSMNCMSIDEALGDQDLMAYVVGELHDLVVRMRPEWLDNEDTSLTSKAFLDEAEYQTFKGLVAMKEDSYTFVIEG